ncbi:MAG TPA: IscA/HesB family protein [Desulfobacterales bacterium]|nr:IscA/HesB family protein [Desulfobacterales bacterium]
MLEVTKSATDKIAEYFKNREVSPIRIFLNAGGCGLPSLALDLDEPKDTDNVFDIDGFQFIIDKEFMKEAEPIKVDFTRSGFQFDCSLEFEEGCSACATSSACG